MVHTNAPSASLVHWLLIFFTIQYIIISVWSEMSVSFSPQSDPHIWWQFSSALSMIGSIIISSTYTIKIHRDKIEVHFCTHTNPCIKVNITCLTWMAGEVVAERLMIKPSIGYRTSLYSHALDCFCNDSHKPAKHFHNIQDNIYNMQLCHSECTEVFYFSYPSAVSSKYN